MSSEQIIEQTKKHWPWVLGAVAGLYIISKYYGGASSATIANPTASQAAASQAYYAAKNQAATIAGQTANQTLAISNAGQSEYLRSQAQVANAVLNGAVNLAVAQSIIPIAAINSATQQNQFALASASDIVNGTNSATMSLLDAQAKTAAASAIAAAQSSASAASTVNNFVTNETQKQIASGNNTSSYVGTAASVATTLGPMLL